MKVSREQAERNRARIVDVAAKLFREKGYDGIGVADLMKSAGLTHGGFYGHFGSKEDLLGEAVEHAAKASLARWDARIAKSATPADALAFITDAYVSAAHRDDRGLGCAVTALGADVSRLTSSARHALSEGVSAQIKQLATLMPDAATPQEARAKAINTYASMVGAIMLARILEEPAASDEVLHTVAAALR